MLLYRPTGLRELELVAASGWRQWPPRLPDQPIFYPVLTLSYAVSIARDWNATDAFSGYVGFVTRFQISDAFAGRYPVQQAGGRTHTELWVPADELPTLNDNIRGFIEVVGAFNDPKSGVALDPHTHLPAGMSPPVVAGPDSPGLSCPCCRALTLRERGGFLLCEVCFWEDDGQDDLDADDVRGGPNGALSLSQARENFARCGASDERFLGQSRAPLAHER